MSHYLRFLFEFYLTFLGSGERIGGQKRTVMAYFDLLDYFSKKEIIFPSCWVTFGSRQSQKVHPCRFHGKDPDHQINNPHQPPHCPPHCPHYPGVKTGAFWLTAPWYISFSGEESLRLPYYATHYFDPCA